MNQSGAFSRPDFPRSAARSVLNKWWLPESQDVLSTRFVPAFASVVGFFNTLLVHSYDVTSIGIVRI